MYQINRHSWLFLMLLILMTVDAQNSSIVSALSDSTSCAVRWTLTPDAILSLQATSPKLHQRMWLYITSLGCAANAAGNETGVSSESLARTFLSLLEINRSKTETNHPYTIILYWLLLKSHLRLHPVLSAATSNSQNILCHCYTFWMPLLWQNLMLSSNWRPMLATIKVTLWSLPRHTVKPNIQTSVLNIPGYTLHHHDRQRRRGGGVAVYMRSTLQSTVRAYSVDDWVYELHWQRTGDLFLGSAYHPRRPLYTTDSTAWLHWSICRWN